MRPVVRESLKSCEAADVIQSGSADKEKVKVTIAALEFTLAHKQQVVLVLCNCQRKDVLLFFG